MKLVSVWKETANLLYWTMLAACTVGPGTVVTCARAGSEYDLSLIWALLFASVLAFTLQEGTARLTIISGKSLGQCLRVKYKSGAKLYDTALVCWLVAGLVCVGNTLYECNNWAGGIDAVFALPELHNSWLVRVAACTAYGNSCVFLSMKAQNAFFYLLTKLFSWNQKRANTSDYTFFSCCCIGAPLHGQS